MTRSSRGFPLTLLVPVLAALLTAATGCTSALTTASLRGLPWDTAETAAEASEETAAVAAESDTDEADDAGPAADHDARRAAAIEEAISRLSTVGSLDEQAQATLMATLQNTAPEDWPVVVAEFAAALAKAGSEAATPHVAAKAESSAATPAPAAASVAPSAPDAPAPAEPAPVPAAEPAAAPEPPASPAEAATPPSPSMSIRTACFASRVQAWGVFDRFPADQFAPGQEVIVYVELDDLAATTAADGHTTCIDASLRLVDADGRTLADWSFEPIAETCASRRRDYFARFVVRIPETAAAGRAHVAVAVTDTLAGKTVETTLPLEIAAD